MTLTRTAPSVETVTPIKYSEALRLGRLLAPTPIKGAWYDGKGGACAVGAIALGLGWRPADEADGSMGANVDCNLFAGDALGALKYDIETLNDGLGYTDAQLIDWLEAEGL